jgi:hypothetical protein
MNLLPYSVISLLAGLAESAGLAGGDNPDNWQGLTTSALAGAAAALVVAILLTVYFRSGYRSRRDIVRHGLAAVAALGLAFVAYDMRHAALDYLGISLTKPQIGLESRQPTATARAATETGTPSRSDQNQTCPT